MRSWLPRVVLVTLAAFVAVAVLTHTQTADSDQPATPNATLTIASGAPVTPVPRSYFGLSTEYWSVPFYAQHLSLFERVLSMLRVPGNGPMVLRIGGDSAERSFWNPRHKRLPSWAFSITPSWTTVVARLVRRLGLHLIIDLNLITSSRRDSVAWVDAAERRLPRHSIIGFEVGNEPDIYRHAAWLEWTAFKPSGAALPLTVTPGEYVTDFHAYARLLARLAPRVPLLGPALANPHPHVGWIDALVASHQPALRTVSAHRYAFAGCVGPWSPHYPTIARLLSPSASDGLAASLIPAISAAHVAGLQFRLTELNSVNCGGRAGVSNAFVTALWAPDALFDLLHVGVDAVNIHIRAETINAPFVFSRSGLDARPLLYGLLMFVRTLGTDPRAVPLSLDAKPSLRLDAWAVRSGADSLHVLLINKGRREVRVRLEIPGVGQGLIQRLEAPSARALSGVTIDGQWLGRRGQWLGTRSTETVSPSRRGYVIVARRYSETLLSVRLKPGTLSTELPRGI